MLFVVSKNTIFISTLFREEPFLFLTHRVLPLVGLAILIVTVMSFNWHYSTLASGRGLFLFHESLRLGIVKNELVDNLKLDIENEVFGFQIDIDSLLELLNEPVLYKHISKYPTVERDLNFVIDETIKAGEIVNKIRNMKIRQLKSIIPTNIFRHASIGKSKKSIVYNIIFQDDTKTLEDKDVNSIIDEIISIVKVNYNAKLRA